MSLFLIATLLHTASAYDCNVTFINSRLDVETNTLCQYLNYHAFMLVCFGLTFVVLFTVTMGTLLCNGGVVTDGVEQCAKICFICFFLAFGLESWLAFVYVALAILYLCVPVSVLLSTVRRPNAVVDVVVVVEIETDPVVSDDTVCPICLESGAGRRWSETKCGHLFHVDCISQWRLTCPMCRAELCSVV
jgi:hypothetical protein